VNGRKRRVEISTNVFDIRTALQSALQAFLWRHMQQPNRLGKYGRARFEIQKNVTLTLRGTAKRAARLLAGATPDDMFTRK
jgi:hypothetical protein